MAPADRARPGQADLRDDTTLGDSPLVHHGVVVRTGLDRYRRAERQDAIRLPERIETHVAQASGAVVVPAAIQAVRVVRVVRTIERRALPQRPVEALRE